MEVTLKEAAILCKKSEKTLRRKIDAGLLEGRREPLEFGGFMWMIDVDSLDEVYPGSRPSQLPQVYDAPEPPQVRLKNRPEDEHKAQTHLTLSEEDRGKTASDDLEEFEENDDDEEWSAKQSFFDYILDENRTLKTELKQRDARILNLNERAFVLERALGEQEGTSATQARVLEWFQAQESAREKKRQENEEKLLSAGPDTDTAPETKANVWAAALAGAGVAILFMILLLATGALNLSS